MDTSANLLVLDDFPDGAEAVATWLSIEGWKTVCATSTEQALATLNSHRLQAIVMEPYLRAGPAWAVAIAARKLSPRPLLVAISWSVRAGDQSSYEPTLFDHNLFKPASMIQLSEVLSSMRER